MPSSVVKSAQEMNKDKIFCAVSVEMFAQFDFNYAREASPDSVYPTRNPLSVSPKRWIQLTISLFIADLQLILDTMGVVCSPVACRQMSCCEAVYMWTDDTSSDKLNTIDYTRHLLQLGQKLADSDADIESREYSEDILTFIRRLERVYRHLLENHRKQLEVYGLLKAVETYSQGFTRFANYWDLLPSKGVPQ